MKIQIDINTWETTLEDFKSYIEYHTKDGSMNGLNPRLIHHLELYEENYFCYTDKFSSLGEAVEFITTNIYPKVVVEMYKGKPQITIYHGYIE